MDPQTFISLIDAYCRDTGLQPSTVCSKAVGNPRLYDRLKGRMLKLGIEGQMLERWILNNPPKGGDSE